MHYIIIYLFIGVGIYLVTTRARLSAMGNQRLGNVIRESYSFWFICLLLWPYIAYEINFTDID